jgi:hypothetical protein
VLATVCTLRTHGSGNVAIQYFDSSMLQAPVGKLVARMLRALPAIDDERIARGHISSFSTRQSINVVWGVSKLALHDAALYEVSASLLIPRMADVGDRGLAMLASAFGSGDVQARLRREIALPMLCAVSDAALSRVEKGKIIPDVLAQCIWHLWEASTAAARDTWGNVRQVSAADKTQQPCIGTSAKPISAAEEGGDVIEEVSAGTAPGALAMRPAGGAMVPSDKQSVRATPRGLRDCVRSLVGALSTIPPQVRVPTSLRSHISSSWH